MMTRPSARAGFTLVELLVVIAIIGILIALVFPSLSGARSRALEIVCANNLRQINVLLTLHANEHRGKLPQGYAGNPATFLIPTGEVVDAYMKSKGMPPDIWYCPALAKSVSSTMGMAGPPLVTSWRNPVVSGIAFRIGYVYLGDPAPPESMRKFTAPDQVPRNLLKDLPILLDFCATWEPVRPPLARDVTPWDDFPHWNPSRPRVQNVLMVSGGVRRQGVEDMRLQYIYVHPRYLYW